jgi:hypothetical protein
MGLVSVCSPLPYTNYATAVTAALAGYIGLSYDIRTLVGHTRFQSFEIERALWNDKNKMVGAPALFHDIGMDALERLVRSKKLGPMSVKDNSVSLEKGFLDLLPGSRKQDPEMYIRLADCLPPVFFSASQYYDLVLIDAASRDAMADIAIRYSDCFLVVVNQDMNILEKFFSGEDRPGFLDEKPYLLVISQYDGESKYTLSNLKRYFNIKGPVAAIPYCTGYADAINDQDAVGWLRRHSLVGKKHENYAFIESVRKLSRLVLEAVDVNPDLKETERGVS